MAKIDQAETGTLAFVVVVLLGAAYGFGSWAIDSGSILVYGLSFACVYAAIRVSIQAVKRKAHDNITKTRRIKKA